jgi:hypothetical protein
VNRLAASLISATFLLRHFGWDSETNVSVRRAAFALVHKIIVVNNDHLIAKESRRFRPCVSDERFRLRKLQLQLISKEDSDLFFDRFRLNARPAESEQPIVRIPDIPKPTVSWIGRVNRGEALTLPSQGPCFLSTPFPF